ncbi:hypothetical protein MY10362_009070 [Beauveria mimosiformis]
MQKLPLEEILKMSNDDDNATGFRGFFGSSTSAHHSKRTRVDSVSDESADEGSSESDSKPSAQKKSESPDSVVLVSAKAIRTGDDGGKKRDKKRVILKPKSRAHRQKSEDNATGEDIKVEEED